MDCKKVVFIEDDSKIRASRYHTGIHLDSEVSLVSYQYELEEFRGSYEVDDSDLRKGACLAKHPFDNNRYVSIAKMQEIEKQLILSNIYKLAVALGAKSFQHKEITKTYNCCEKKIEVDGNVKLVKLKGKINSKAIKEEEGEWMIAMKNQGGSPNIKEAERLLQEHSFSETLKACVYAAQLQNRTEKYQEKISTSSVSNSSMEIALSIGVVGSKIFSLDGNFCDELTERREFYRELLIEW